MRANPELRTDGGSKSIDVQLDLDGHYQPVLFDVDSLGSDHPIVEAAKERHLHLVVEGGELATATSFFAAETEDAPEDVIA